MTDAEFNALMELSKKKMTPEEAMDVFVGAGILDEKGNFREPYTILESYFVRRVTPKS